MCDDINISEKDRLLADKMAAIEGGGGDQEDNHLKADHILLDILADLGYVRTVEEFCKIDKWYA